MPGTIRRRGQQTWELRYDAARDPRTGERRLRYSYVRGTRREAERALSELIHRRDNGMDIEPAKTTVAAYLDRWLQDYAQPNVAPSTLVRYRGFARRLTEIVGQCRLQELRPATVQDAYSRLLAEGLAARTVLHHHRMLRQALHHAVRWQILPTNPADAVLPPKPRRTTARTLDAQGVNALLAACEDPQTRTLVFVAVWTGMRLGELLALRWSDLKLDLETGAAHVSRTAQYLSSELGVTFGTPKTAHSRRTVALSPETVRVLRKHHTLQLERRLALGDAYHDGDLVFPRRAGEPVPPSNISHAFVRLVKRAGVGPLRFHDLRHTAATLMLRAEVHPKVVSERLGHSTISVTMDLYSHVIPSMQREAAEALDNVLAVEKDRKRVFSRPRSTSAPQ